jgi:phage baseplate assembly protein W
MSQEFLGSGWSFPLALNENGDIGLSRAEENIRQSIEIILGTAPGERLMRPDFGCGIHELVFEPNTVATAGRARFAVEQALALWEPRIIVDDIQVGVEPSDPALLMITINYRERATDSRFNLVYPFYLTRGATS